MFPHTLCLCSESFDDRTIDTKEHTGHITFSVFIRVAAVEWYLLSNGSDTSTCGRNVSNACRTLDWLLGRFYNTSLKHKQVLSLGTDIDLTVDIVLLVSLSYQLN